MLCLQPWISQEIVVSWLAVCSDHSADGFWAPLRVQLSRHSTSHAMAVSGGLTEAGLHTKVMAKQRHPQLKAMTNRHGKKHSG